MKHSPLVLLATLLCACGPATRLLPASGELAATRHGAAARLRVYYCPPLRGLLPPGTVALYIELRNDGGRSLRVAYPDLALLSRDGRAAPPLRPGDVLRPSRLSAGQRRLLASVTPESALRRAAPAATHAPWLRGMAAEDTDDAVDFLAPQARYRINGTWIMQNDLGVGPQLHRDGWPFFGMPPLAQGQALSLFDLLQATLPDGELQPGAELAGFLFFPAAAAQGAAGLRWSVREADARPRELLSVPLRPAP